MYQAWYMAWVVSWEGWLYGFLAAVSLALVWVAWESAKKD